MSLHTRVIQYPYRGAKPSERVAMSMVTMTMLPFPQDSRLEMLMMLLATETIDLIETDAQVDAAADLFRLTLKKLRHDFAEN